MLNVEKFDYYMQYRLAVRPYVGASYGDIWDVLHAAFCFATEF
jgi:hypothetical protein